jgi:hypothetical protein
VRADVFQFPSGDKMTGTNDFGCIGRSDERILEPIIDPEHEEYNGQTQDSITDTFLHIQALMPPKDSNEKSNRENDFDTGILFPKIGILDFLRFIPDV